jgi:nucleosome binding factor SPN SPT16 subunit
MELKKKKLEELKQRLNETFSGSLKKIKQVDSDKVECYKNREEFPKDIKKNKIYVDAKNSALLLPINGVMVPFNINVLKNIVKYE